MSLRTTMTTATAVAAVATGGILAAPAGAVAPAVPAGAKCDSGHGMVREGTVLHTRIGTYTCRNGNWSYK